MGILFICFIMKISISPLIKRYLEFPKKFYKTLRWLRVFVTSHETYNQHDISKLTFLKTALLGVDKVQGFFKSLFFCSCVREI